MWRGEFFKIAKCDFTFMREMRVHVWQGRNWLPKTGRANSNVAHRHCPAAPSILPKSGWEVTSLFGVFLTYFGRKLADDGGILQVF